MHSEEALKTCLKLKDLFKLWAYQRKFKADNPDFFNPSGFTLFCGAQGNGKTLSAARYVNNLCKLYPKSLVVSNCHLSLPNYKGEIIDYSGIDDLAELDNESLGIIAFLDEIQIEFNSLESKKIDPSVFQVISQQRKRRLHIVGTAQMFSRVAKPFREQVSSVIDCKCYFNCLQRNQKIDFGSIAYDAEGNLKDYKYLGSSWFFRTPELFDMYDTFQRVQKFGQ